MRHKRPAPSGPFSRFMSVDELSGLPDDSITITANEAERTALAELNELPGISKFAAAFKIRSGSRDIHLTGRINAHITQTCVVTLDPFEAVIGEPLDIRFAAPKPYEKPGKNPEGKGKKAPRIADLVSEGLEADPPEPLVDGHIDLGAVAAEFFALSLDPYPRKPGVDFEANAREALGIEDEGETDAEDKPGNPFAILASLQHQDKAKR